jgi:hypothetical protein
MRSACQPLPAGRSSTLPYCTSPSSRLRAHIISRKELFCGMHRCVVQACLSGVAASDADGAYGPVGCSGSSCQHPIPGLAPLVESSKPANRMPQCGSIRQIARHYWPAAPTPAASAACPQRVALAALRSLKKAIVTMINVIRDRVARVTCWASGVGWLSIGGRNLYVRLNSCSYCCRFSRRGRCALGQRRLDMDGLLPAHHREVDGVARLVAVDDLGEARVVRHRVTIRGTSRMLMSTSTRPGGPGESGADTSR